MEHTIWAHMLRSVIDSVYARFDLEDDSEVTKRLEVEGSIVPRSIASSFESGFAVKRASGKTSRHSVKKAEDAGQIPRQSAYSQALVLKPSEVAFSETARLI